MKVAILSGSVRDGSNTTQLMRYTENWFVDQGNEIKFFDALQLKLNLPGRNDFPKNDADQMSQAVGESDAVVLATPEYHGSYSAALKLMVENLGYPSVMAGKPLALVGVAAGRIGAIKALEHMRGMTGHLGCMTFPEVFSIAAIHKEFTLADGFQSPLLEEEYHKFLHRFVDYVERVTHSR